MYFLAIVARDDLLRGHIRPSYVLCKSHGDSENRSPWRVYRANTPLVNCPKVLVKWPGGNDLMIDFLSKYRTRDHIHDPDSKHYDQTKKYYPEGALFWFECNNYGEATGTAVFVKCVPDRKGYKDDGGKQRFDEALSKTPTAKDLFSSDPFAKCLEQSGVKPRMFQYSQRVSNK